MNEMNQNKTDDSKHISDDSILSQMQTYFTLLRKDTGKCAVPSKIEDELLCIIKYSLRSSNPLVFLQETGLIFFDKCCGVNISLLSKNIFSCRSRISSSFRREKWSSTFSDDHFYKQQIQKIISSGESRNWSLREYPPNSKIMKCVTQFHQIIPQKSGPVIQIEKKIEESKEAFELTLQKDIFSWTFFDEF
ncbi:hypothetical protein TRFO_05686 [Tritrichomonas foetus]|uniref:Initiator binding domain-containing protein n=1 Tax=Tritrichomonas foetus TaxID=1144522 RepID=A0A1J4K9C1_9EUKA|nr:hypothetical protein TRFO_05686 [Tritrichomonas foetus]|eukprot:OHT06045.1 hypothetical protein TRFO_05686 [Tritrichomonas foetus]